MAKIQITEKNFDSGFRGKYKGYHIDTRLITMPQPTSPIYQKLLNYKTIKIININIMALELFDSIVYLNEQIQNVYINYSKRGVIENLYKINIEKENIIHVMKRIIDDLIILLCIYYDTEGIYKRTKISITSIGEIINNSSTLGMRIKDDLNYSKYEFLFKTINDLHNAYKHSCFMIEAHQEFATEGVSLTAYYAKHNKFDKLEYHNHNCMHIVVSFSDFLLEFCNIETSNKKININTQSRYIEI